MKTATDGYGVSIGYSYSKYNNFGSSANDYANQRNNSVNLSIFKRKYIPIHSKWSLFYDVGLSGVINKTKNIQSGSFGA
jgi:hypothetical protein